jgi:hypothetical protein
VTTLTGAQAAVVLAPNVGMLSTLRSDGTAHLTLEGAEDHIDKMARKYLGEETYPAELRAPGERRVLARIALTKVTAWNVD